MKKLLKFGVASLSLATLGVVAAATNLPVLGSQVVHAEDNPIVEKGYGASFYVDEGNGPDFVGAIYMSAPPVAENYYGDFSNITNITVELDPEYSAKVKAELPDKDWEWYNVVYYISNSATPKDTNTDPVDNSNADTGGGNSEGGDTQTPPADTPKPQTLTVIETRQDENGAVLSTKTHSLVLNPGEEKDLGYNPDREVLVRGGNLYRYGNFEDGATLYFTTRLKPATVDTGTPADKGAPTETPNPAPTTDTIIALGNHFKTLHDEYVRLGGNIQPGHYFSHERFGVIVNGLLAGDPAVYGAYEFDGIEKRLVDAINKLKAQQPATGNGIVTPPAPQAGKEELTTTRNQLLAQVDQSGLTDAQKGELAVKIAFAETAEELDKLKAELTSLTAPASKPAVASAAKPADQPVATTSGKTLPATGELTREALTAMGLALVLFSLGLAKSRKTN